MFGLKCTWLRSKVRCDKQLFLLSVVAYSVVMGALMASGKEVIGRIPKGKVNLFLLFDDLTYISV